MESFIGQIRIFAGNYAPVHWAFCDGQLLGIAQQQALYSLLGTRYGGNGVSSFGLPDMRGRLPLHYGTGPGLTPRQLGSRFGVESVALTEAQIPSHQHVMQATTNTGNTPDPAGAVLASSPDAFYTTETSPIEDFDAAEVTSTGLGEPHSNMMPTLCLNFIISLTGVYPPRN